MLNKYLKKPYFLAFITFMVASLVKALALLLSLPKVLESSLAISLPMMAIALFTAYIYKAHFSARYKLIASLYSLLGLVLYIAVMLILVKMGAIPSLDSLLTFDSGFFTPTMMLMVSLMAVFSAVLVVGYNYAMYWAGNSVGMSLLRTMQK